MLLNLKWLLKFHRHNQRSLSFNNIVFWLPDVRPLASTFHWQLNTINPRQLINQHGKWKNCHVHNQLINIKTTCDNLIVIRGSHSQTCDNLIIALTVNCDNLFKMLTFDWKWISINNNQLIFPFLWLSRFNYCEQKKILLTIVIVSCYN